MAKRRATATRKSQTMQVQSIPKPHYLSGSCIYLQHVFPELDHTVPPTSPKQLIYDYSFTSLPQLFPTLTDLKLPYIREIGIKASIKELATYFQCKNYKFNLIEFWFLDIITDCLWRAQDEFQFPDKHQKIILEWILYIFNLIRAPNLNLTRKKLFKLFKEAMLIAENYIESGCSEIPLPWELFALNLEQMEQERESSTTLNSSGSSTSSDSTISLHSDSVASSYVAVKLDENTQLFKLPMKPCTWVCSDDECLSTSVETVSEEEKPSEVENIHEPNALEEELTISYNDMEFYKEPDLKKIPPRFLPSHDSLIDTISLSVESETIEDISEDCKGSKWVDVPRHQPRADCPNRILTNEAGEDTSNKGEEELMGAWFDFYVWQQRMEDMDNPKKGWIPQTYDKDESKSEPYTENTDKIDAEKMEWLNYIREKQDEITQVEKNIFINSCVLLVIKQFVFEYFYETFSFSLMKLALRYPHSLITQEINEKWYVPKVMKSELKKPKPKKPKKEKKPKEKKEKKAKPKKEKAKKKEKSSKTKSKPSKEKPKKLTKEEKAELARLKKEQELLEQARLKEEENKFFMFPLADAATDDFFKSIFINWVKVEKKAKGKGKGKDKGGKKKKK